MTENKTIRINVTIEGHTDMAQRRFRTEDVPLKGCEYLSEPLYYEGPDGVRGIPAYMLWCCLRDAGEHLKLNDGEVVTIWGMSWLRDIIEQFPDDLFLPFVDQSDKGQPSEVTLNIGDHGERKVLPVWSYKWGWRIDFTIHYKMNGPATIDELRELFRIAAHQIGLGSRAVQRGTFGVIRWEVQEDRPTER